MPGGRDRDGPRSGLELEAPDLWRHRRLAVGRIREAAVTEPRREQRDVVLERAFEEHHGGQQRAPVEEIVSDDRGACAHAARALAARARPARARRVRRRQPLGTPARGLRHVASQAVTLPHLDPQRPRPSSHSLASWPATDEVGAS